MARYRYLILLLVAVAIGLSLYGMLSGGGTAPRVTFVSLKGETITPDELHGKVVLVNFWATDCAVCVREMPEMVSTYDRYRGRGFELIAVAMRYDPPNYVLDYTEKHALPFRVALDARGDLARAFGNVAFTPTTFVIDRQGKIVGRILGEIDFAKLHALLEKELKGPA